tara:strand:+ start:41754 stop:42806 length:1053 start_codon:yes stop_codon:yes gene_type:complete
MKLILTAIITSVLMACSPTHNVNPSESIDILDPSGNSKPQDGGVDVGPNKVKANRFLVYKLSLQPIPGTQLFISVPFGWKKTELANGLEISNYDGSKLTVTKAKIEGNAGPTLTDLKVYLKAKYPARKYSDIKINGSEGFSAEVTNAEGQLETDVYLISEFKDFIHVRMNLRHKTTVLVSGQSVLESIQTKRDDEPVSLSVVRHVTLRAGITNNEVPLDFAQKSETSLSVKGSKSGAGYIVEIDASHGTTDFDAIKSANKGIMFGDDKSVPIENIETVFQSSDRTLPKNIVYLKDGGVYLVRAENGLFTDSITKVLVESLEPGKSVTLKYQTLMSVPVGILIHPPKGLKN